MPDTAAREGMAKSQGSTSRWMATVWLRWCREKPHIWKDHERAARLFARYIGLLSAKARLSPGRT